MHPLLRRAVVMALVGAAAGAAALVALFNLHPALVFEMDQDVPARAITGVHPVEIHGDESFAWTMDRAQLNVQGVDRRMAWTCRAVFRGGRAPDQPQPDVSFVLDGSVLATRASTNEYATLEATLPSRSQRGLRLALTSSQTFVPGPGDSRTLGVQLDRLECRPEPGRIVLPPVPAIGTAALAAAMFGAMFVGAGAGAWLAAAATLGLALVQAVPLSTGLGPYTPYIDRMVWAALWIAGLGAAGVAGLQRWRPLSAGARLAAAFTAAILFVKLLALLHPAKPIVDAVFHAHRLGYVLGGRYFFTQLMPGGVEFPYAIALYVFAAPWAELTRDHVALLRVVVTGSEAVAGILLYWAVAVRWRDGAVAAVTLVLFHMLPVSFWVIGNANLTNAFGQQAALAAMAALVGWRLGARDWWQTAALAALAAAAILAHVSTAALLVATMAAAAVALRVGAGKEATPPARMMLIAAGVAMAVSVALYYGRSEFAEAYASVGGTQTAVGTAAPMSLALRAKEAILLSGDAIGWPILALSLLGAVRLATGGFRDRLTWVLIGWLLACGAFVLVGLLTPTAPGHQRYTLEFIVRAVYAGAPAVLALAGLGTAWAWRLGSPHRFVAIVLVALAVLGAGRLWVNWVA